MYDTVIFDLDGTLLDTLEDLTDAVNFCLNKYGYNVRSKKEIRSFVGNGIYVLMKRALPGDIDEESFEKVFLEFREYYTSHCRIKTKPYEGIEELLTSLDLYGYKMAVVSNKNDAAVKELCKYYFEDVINLSIGEKEGIRKKPAPDTVNEAMKIIGSVREKTLYVGDSEVDKETADNAKVDCMLVDWGFRDRDKLLKLNPKYIINRPEDLLTKL